MDLFVCSTAYQLYNAICIVTNSKRNAELMIVRDSLIDNCKFDTLIKTGFFSSVYIWTELMKKVTDGNVKKRRDKIKRYRKIFEAIIVRKQIWNSLPNKGMHYNQIFIGYDDFVCQFIWSYFKKKGSKIALYEEGTYTYACLQNSVPLLKKIIQKIFFGSVLQKSVREIYVRNPSLLKIKQNPNVKIKKIDFKEDSKIRCSIYSIFNVKEETIKILDKKVIIFDQNIELKDIRNIQWEIAQKCCEIFGNENIAIKLHPSSAITSYKNISNIYCDRVPFEILLPALNLDDKILISIFSTACFSPKQYLNREPYVLFTYGIMKSKITIHDQYLALIDDLVKLYKKRNRILAPATIAELEECLNRIKTAEMNVQS